MDQKIISVSDNYDELKEWISRFHKIFLVCGNSARFLQTDQYLRSSNIVRFSDFQPNPLYENVLAGVERFRAEGCDALIAVGGGSAMDVAKCVKAWCHAEGDGAGGSFLSRKIEPNGIPFLAMPTTAGTGSEATRYAVIYFEGKKQSITDESLIPDTVLMDPSCLRSLPVYQKKVTMCDAFCHALESFWSVNSTSASRSFSRTAIREVLAHMEGYLANTEAGNAGMLQAAFTAGQAINVTQTTAGHAMCYKLTGLYHIAHGHAAMLCDRVLFPHMIRNTEKCIDPRGEDFLRETLYEVGQAMGCPDAESGAEKLRMIFEKLELDIPAASAEQYEALKTSVNPVRLKNHPILLDEKAIDDLYHEILRQTNES